MRRALPLLAVLFALALPAGASAAPPTCPNASLVTTPGTPLALPSSPCTDPDAGDTVTVAAVTLPQHGTLTATAYTPGPGFHGRDQFTYQGTDNNNEKSGIATVSILVDTEPTCSNVALSVPAGGRIALPANPCADADGDGMDIFIDVDPSHGDLDFSGSVPVYVPTPGFVGTDAVEIYAVDDFGLDSFNSTVTITVTAPPVTNPAPAPPAAQPQDTSAPVASLAAPSGQKLKQVLSKGLRLTLSANEAGAATVVVTVDAATARKLKLKGELGRATAAAQAGKVQLTVKFTAKARKALKKVAKVKLTLQLTIKDAAGNTTAKKVTLTLKR